MHKFFAIIIRCRSFFFFILTVGENYPSHYSTHDRTMPLFKTLTLDIMVEMHSLTLSFFLLYYNLQVYYLNTTKREQH